MINFNPRLQSRSSLAKSGSPLVEPSKFLGLKNSVSSARLTIDRIAPLLINAPLIQTSKYLAIPQQKSAIGWDSWEPGLRSNDSNSLLDRSNRISSNNDEVNSDNSDILTTIFHPLLDIEDSTTIDDRNARDEPQSPIIRQDEDRLVSEDKLIPDRSAPTVPYISNKSDFNRTGSTEIDRIINPEIVIDSESRSMPDLFLSEEIRSTNIDFVPTIVHEPDKIEEFIPDLPTTNLAKEQSISDLSVNNFQQSLSNLLTPVETIQRNIDSEYTVFDGINDTVQSISESSVTNLKPEVINPKIDTDNFGQSVASTELPSTIFHEVAEEVLKPVSEQPVTNLTPVVISPKIAVDNSVRSGEHIDLLTTESHEIIGLEKTTSESLVINPIVNKASPDIDNSSRSRENIDSIPKIFHEPALEASAANLTPAVINLQIDIDNADLEPTIFHEIIEVDESSSDSPEANLRTERVTSEIDVDNSDQLLPDRLSSKEATLASIDRSPITFDPVNEVDRSNSELLYKHTPVQISDEIVKDIYAQSSPNIDVPPTIFHDLNEVEESDLDPPVANSVQEQISTEIVRNNFTQASQNVNPAEVIFLDRDEAEIPIIVLPTDNLAPDGVSPEITVENTNRSTDDRLGEDNINTNLSTVFKIENELDPAITAISKSELSTNLILENISSETPIDPPTISPRLDLDEYLPTIFHDLIADVDSKPFDRIDLLAEEIEVLPDPSIEQNDLPVKGYATGGQVADTHNISDTIHPSDTVAAMLTPKEFVVNVRDAQKNINLLEHINSGGDLTEFTPLNAPSTVFSDPTPSRESPAQISTKVESFVDVPLQLKRDDLLRSPSLAELIEDRPNSIVNNFEGDTVVSRSAITNYDSPPLIFRKPKSSNNLPETQFTDPPSQWNSVEDLLTGNDSRSTIFNFSDNVDNGNKNYSSNQTYSPEMMSNQQINLTDNSITSGSSIVNRFDNNDRVVARDIATDIEPITETIEPLDPQSEKKDDAGEIEALAREIYHRLRQRLEVERERQGIYNGRLPW